MSPNWETYTHGGDGPIVWRLAVPGGWLYMTESRRWFEGDGQHGFFVEGWHAPIFVPAIPVVELPDGRIIVGGCIYKDRRQFDAAAEWIAGERRSESEGGSKR